MRRPMRRASRRRPKKRFIWLGGMVKSLPLSNGTSIDPATWVSVISLVDESVLGLGTDLLIHRVIFAFNVTSPFIAVPNTATLWMGVYPTDLSYNPIGVPAGDNQDPDFFVKREPMWMGIYPLPAEGQVGNMPRQYPESSDGTNLILLNNGNPYDIRVKRKINGQKELCFCGSYDPEGSEEPQAPSLDIWWRVLVSGGLR